MTSGQHKILDKIASGLPMHIERLAIKLEVLRNVSWVSIKDFAARRFYKDCQPKKILEILIIDTRY